MIFAVLYLQPLGHHCFITAWDISKVETDDLQVHEHATVTDWLLLAITHKRVIADLVSNFVAMATRVGRGRIGLTSFNSSTPKTPCYAQWSRRYLLHKPSYSLFCLKFRCHGNKGWSEVNLNDTVELAVPENQTLEPKITTLSSIQPKLWQFEEFLNFPHRRHCIFCWIFWINKLNIKFKFSNPQKALRCAEPRHMSHRALKSVQWFLL